MPHPNLELADRAVAAINETYRTGDMAPWREFVEATCAPEIVLEPAAGAFTEGDWRGHDGAVAFVANQMEVLNDMWLRVEEYLRVDDDMIVLAVTFGGRARHSGLEVELHPVHVFTMHDGKATRWQIFLERGPALEAAGLAP
jgi:ketosteroid isomerase-like protein